MITTDAVAVFTAVARRLEQRAAALAEARVREARLAHRRDARRWRAAGLLWPLFGKGQP